MPMSIRSRAPKASSEFVRRVMTSIASVDTFPEQVLRSALHRRGLRFRKNARPEKDIRIVVDIVFPRRKVCVFVDGCFWHKCPVHFSIPKTNSDWWIEKIEDNVARDIRQSSVLSQRGWSVLRVWEHEVQSANLPSLCERIQTLLSEKAG